MKPSPFPLLPSSFVLGCAIAALFIALPYLVRPGVELDFDQDSPFRLKYARGFYPAERTADNVPFAWTAGRAVLTLRSIPRATPWRFEATLAIPRPEPGTSEVTLLVDRVEVARWQLSRSASHELQAPVPAARSERGVQVELRVADVFSPGRDDPRELGLLIERIAFVPERRFRSLPIGPVSRFAVSVGLLSAVVALLTGLRFAAVTVASASAALSVLAFHESALYLEFDQIVLPSVGAALIVLGCGLTLRHLHGLSSSAWTTATLSIGLAATFVKILVVLHPGLTLGDSVFHLNRLQLVREGTWFFTSQAPGGQFPYPVAFYVIVSRLPIANVDWIPLMRGFAIVIDGLVAICLALTVARERSDRAGLFTIGTWHALPALFQVQGIAYLTNAFGNLVAALSLVAVVFAKKERWQLPLVIATIGATLAFLSHVSSFLILLGTLLAVMLVAVLWKRRTLAVVAMAVAVVAATAAWTTYYRHFTSVYGELSARRADPSPPVSVPAQRAEAHQTVFVSGWIPLRNRIGAIPGYLGKYFGWPVIVLSMAGVLHTARRGVRRDELDIVLIAWILAAFGFLLISLFTPLDLRYYLAAAPAVAALGGTTVDRWVSSSDQRTPIAAYGLFALVVIQGIAYVARFFITIPR
jgi:hypothetical protein